MRGEIQDIRKSYGRKAVLRGASFPVHSGGCAGIVGANGSGKSTLLRVLAGVLRPEGGRFLWEGTDLLADRAAAERTVAYVPQGTPLIGELSALDNLRLWYDRDAMQASLDHGVLRELGVHEFLKTPAAKLSGGMRKRLSIGCAMSGNPHILLLDEPTAALDLVCKEKLMAYFSAFRARGGLIILATHDLWELECCDSLHLLSGGVLTPYAYDGDARRLAREIERA